MGNKTVGGHNGLTLSALGKRHQGIGPGIFSVGWQIEEQPTGQRIIFRGNQAVERRHGLRLTVDNGHGFSLAHVGQTDETDALRVSADRIGQLFAGLEALRRTAEGFPVAAEDQFLEGVVGPGLIIPCIQMNRPAATANVFPALHLATENARQLHGVELVQRIVRMKDDRQAIDGNDLFGARAFQVTERLQAGQFAVLDRARRGGQIGAGCFECSETGAGAMGRYLHHDPTALNGFADDAQFVGGVRGFTADLAQALFTQQTLDQRRPQCRTDGVGTLNPQRRAVFGCRQVAGRGRLRQARAQHQQEQHAQHHAGTIYSQRRCREIKSVRFPKNDALQMWERACSRRGHNIQCRC
ncbi:hypothetical protein D3C80_775800 [compost metagenome]